MSNLTIENCVCQNDREHPIDEKFITEISRVRDNCTALKKIILPDKSWSSYRNLPAGGIGKVKHLPLSFVAMHRGVLSRLTSPIHQFLLDDTGEIKSEINPNYLSDLNETWLLDRKETCRNTELRRHQRSRIYTGKLVELLCAYWLEHKKWEVLDLEAWKNRTTTKNCFPDIKALTPEGKICSIEVKFFGVADQLFKSFSDSNAYSYSDSEIVTFILCKLYEAAIQVKNCESDRMMFLVVDQNSWSFMERYWTWNWIDWNRVKLDPDSKFLARFQEKHTNIKDDLHDTLKILKEFWVILMTGKLSLEHKHSVLLS